MDCSSQILDYGQYMQKNREFGKPLNPGFY